MFIVIWGLFFFGAFALFAGYFYKSFQASRHRFPDEAPIDYIDEAICSVFFYGSGRGVWFVRISLKADSITFVSYHPIDYSLTQPRRLTIPISQISSFRRPFALFARGKFLIDIKNPPINVGHRITVVTNDREFSDRVESVVTASNGTV